MEMKSRRSKQLKEGFIWFAVWECHHGRDDKAEQGSRLAHVRRWSLGGEPSWAAVTLQEEVVTDVVCTRCQHQYSHQSKVLPTPWVGDIGVLDMAVLSPPHPQGCLTKNSTVLHIAWPQQPPWALSGVSMALSLLHLPCLWNKCHLDNVYYLCFSCRDKIPWAKATWKRKNLF